MAIKTVMEKAVRQKPDGRYELISGHRRKHASELARRDTLPAIASILAKPKPNQEESVKLPRERFDRYFPKDATPRQIEDTIFKALELLRKHERSRAMER